MHSQHLSSQYNQNKCCTDTTQIIQVFWDTHSITSLKTLISSTSTKRTLHVTSPPLCAQTALFVTHHWSSLTIYCPVVLVAGGAGCSGMWASLQVLVFSLQHTTSRLSAAHSHRMWTSCPIINPARATNKEIISSRMFRIATSAGELGYGNRYSD
jgi:hypothetical protein